MESQQATNKGGKAEYRHALRLVEESSSIEDETSRRRLLSRAIQLLTKGIQSDPSDPELFYLRGYSYYMLPAKTDEERGEAFASLNECTRLNPYHQFGWYYLAALSFDRADYSLARSFLSRIDVQSFMAMGQEWRALKMAELAACCDCYLGEAGCQKRIETVIQLYSEFPDPELLPVPWELCRFLDESIKSKKMLAEELRAVGKDLQKILAELRMQRNVEAVYPSLWCITCSQEGKSDSE